ncbi:MAG: YicC family protein [bacterium]|nr:YicC family protein [bacterium]
MIKSMTGYGRGEFATDKKIYIAEIKSVNSKYLEMSVRLPVHLQQFEMEIRDLVKNSIKRGKVSIQISETTLSGLPILLEIDDDNIKFVAARLKEIAQCAGISNTIELRDLLYYSEKVTNNNTELQQQALRNLIKVLECALEQFQKMRIQEGKHIYEQFLVCLDNIQSEVSFLSEVSKDLPDFYRNQLLTKLNEAGLSQELIDPNRLVLEVSLLVEKQDIQEELTRLHSHIQQFRSTLDDTNPVGKKLQFLLQEMLREVTTIASKSSNLAMTNSTLRIREIIEMLREQVQNVE